MRLGLLVSARCNASCAHCTVDSGPHQSAELAPDKVRALMDEAAAIWNRDRAAGESLEFNISGGEPFLRFNHLLEFIAHGVALGASVTCVTNGFWASSEERARARLAALQQAGLAALGVSTSRFHQPFVGRDRVQRILVLAPAYGIRTALKCAVTASEQAADKGIGQWARSRRVDKLELFPVMPYLRTGESLPEASFIRKPGIPAGTCPAPTLTVREDGSAYTCCMPGAFKPLLKVGNVHQQPLAALHDRFCLGPVQQTLRDRGPAFLAEAIRADGLGSRLRPEYEGVCDLCAHIAADAPMARVASRSARRHAEQALQTEMERHV